MEESLPRDLTAARQHLEEAPVRIEDQLIERLKADGQDTSQAEQLLPLVWRSGTRSQGFASNWSSGRSPAPKVFRLSATFQFGIG